MLGLAFFVYKRPEHTKKVIESIKRNKFKKVYIFQDGLKKEEDRGDWEEVSRLIKSIDFTDVEVHISEKNKGLANSIVAGMDYVFDRHETAIALEDDVLLADDYKEFIETCLDKYHDNESVMSVCGGGYGTIIPQDYPYDIYFAYRMSSVAFATWRNRWKGFERNPLLLGKILKDEDKKKKLELAGSDIPLLVRMSIMGEVDTWATYWVLHQIFNNGYHIIPKRNYAVDIGRDGTGTNTRSATSRYDIEINEIDCKELTLPEEIYLDNRILHDTKNLFATVTPEKRLKSYYEILLSWINRLHNNKTIETYFFNRHIEKIYIYGIGKLAELLYEEINNRVHVKGFIVENKGQESFVDIPLYDMQDDIVLDNIPILIIPSYDRAIIEHMFIKKGINNKLIYLEEVMED